jgi:dCMP deaminase
MIQKVGRPTIDEYFLRMAYLVSERGTCARRKVGCVLVDYNKHVMATGYNGPPAKWPHCIDQPCAGADSSPGEGLDLCEAVHAESNALLTCPDTTKIWTAYCTDSPCVSCVKLLLNTSCERIVFLRPYPHGRSKDLWLKSQRAWEHNDAAISAF